MDNFCLQEGANGKIIDMNIPEKHTILDLVEFIVTKVLKKLANATQKEQYALAQYIRIQVAETFLAPGEPVSSSSNVTINIYWLNVECFCLQTFSWSFIVG